MRQGYRFIVFIIFGCFFCVNAQNNSADTSILELKQNFPNPFNPSTQVEYYLPEQTYVEFNVYNILGTKIAGLVKSTQEVGWHKIQFNAEHLPTGLYIYELKTPRFKKTRKMLYMK